MKRIVTIFLATAFLSSCTSTPEDTAALIKRTCSVAQDTSIALQPWIDAGVIKGKDASNVSTARIALFAEPNGLCVGEPTGTLAGALVKISSFGLTLAVALRNAKD